MTWQFSVNNFVATAGGDSGRVWSEFIRWLCARPEFELLGSGDGIATFENSGQTGGSGAGPLGAYDVIETPGIGVNWASNVANDWSNTQSWYRWRQVGTTREWNLERSSSASSANQSNFKLRFSPTGFTGNNANANSPPTAADVQYMLGSAGVYSDFHTVDSTYDSYWHAGVNDTAEDGVHAFYFFTTYIPDGLCNSLFALDGVSDKDTGDIEPYVQCCFNGAANFTYITGFRGWPGYYDYGGGSEVWTGFDLQAYYDGVATTFCVPGAQPRQLDGVARSWPILVGAPTTKYYKGILRNFRWHGFANRTYPDVADFSGTPMMHLGHLLVPWPVSTQPK